MFRYYNMDHAIESGIDTAEKIVRGGPRIIREEDGDGELVMTGN
jgi:hypothetical protein